MFADLYEFDDGIKRITHDGRSYRFEEGDEIPCFNTYLKQVESPSSLEDQNNNEDN